MTAYVVVHAKVKDPEKMQTYAGGAGPVVVAHGGEVISRGPSTLLHGESPYDLMVMLQFPTREAAETWYNSDDYQALIPTRDAAMDSVFFVGGE